MDGASLLIDSECLHEARFNCDRGVQGNFLGDRSMRPGIFFQRLSFSNALSSLMTYDMHAHKSLHCLSLSFLDVQLSTNLLIYVTIIIRTILEPFLFVHEDYWLLYNFDLLQTRH